MQETREFWRHSRFHDLGLLKARFRRHRYELHTHPTYVIALITEGCERIRIGNGAVVAPAGTIAVVNPEECHDGEPGAEGGWAYRTFYPSVALMTAVARELGRTAPRFSHASSSRIAGSPERWQWRTKDRNPVIRRVQRHPCSLPCGISSFGTAIGAADPSRSRTPDLGDGSRYTIRSSRTTSPRSSTLNILLRPRA